MSNKFVLLPNHQADVMKWTSKKKALQTAVATFAMFHLLLNVGIPPFSKLFTHIQQRYKY